MSMPLRFAALLTVAVALSGCCRQAKFAAEDRSAPLLADEMTRLGARCDRWFVRECDAKEVHAIWLFRPRIDGPAETSAYDAASGALLYQRQFGTSGGWSFTPVRQYGAAPACRPELDSSGAESACAWIERRKAAPGDLPPATPFPTSTPTQ